MKLFGYVDGSNGQLLNLSEVTLQAESRTLRSVANFLLKCAKEMDENESWEHEHFSDSPFAENLSTDIIVFREK